MTPEQEKKLEKLTKAIDLAYEKPWRVFGRGFLWGLGRGLGVVVGWLILIVVLFVLFKASGLDEAFNTLIQSLQNFSEAAGKIQSSIPFR